MAKGRHVIVLYTPKFIQNCSEHDKLLLQKYNNPLNNRLVYICSKCTLQKLNTRTRLCSLLFRRAHIQCPDTNNQQDMELFLDQIQLICPKNDSRLKDTIKTVQDV